MNLPPAEPAPGSRGQSESSPAPCWPRYRIRTLMMMIAAAAVWFGFFQLPGAPQMVGGLLLLAGGVLAIFLGAMGLGLLGFGIFGLVDRALTRLVRAARWPDDHRFDPLGDELAHNPPADPWETRG